MESGVYAFISYGSRPSLYKLIPTLLGTHAEFILPVRHSFSDGWKFIEGADRHHDHARRRAMGEDGKAMGEEKKWRNNVKIVHKNVFICSIVIVVTSNAANTTNLPPVVQKLPVAPLNTINEQPITQELAADLSADELFKALDLFIAPETTPDPDYIKRINKFLELNSGQSIKNNTDTCALFTDLRFIALPKAAKDYVVLHCRHYYDWQHLDKKNLGQYIYQYILVKHYIDSPEFARALDTHYDAYIKALFHDFEHGGSHAKNDFIKFYKTFYTYPLFVYYDVWCMNPGSVLNKANIPAATFCDLYEDNNGVYLSFLKTLSPYFNQPIPPLKRSFYQFLVDLQHDTTLDNRQKYIASSVWHYQKQNFNGKLLAITPSFTTAMNKIFIAPARYNPLDMQANLANIKNYCLPATIDIMSNWHMGTAVIHYEF